MGTNFKLSYELADNKIPCGGFNLLGGGIKGKNISFARQFNGVAISENKQNFFHPLFLNENDYIKISEGEKKSKTEVVPPIDNIHLFEVDYTDLISYRANAVDFERQSQSDEFFFDDEISAARYFYNHFLPQYSGNNGKAMNLCDICNWYTLPLGFTATGMYKSRDESLYADIYSNISSILELFYSSYTSRGSTIVNIIENSTGLVDTFMLSFMDVVIFLLPSFPDTDEAPITPTLIFTPEGNRFYFAKPNEGN